MVVGDRDVGACGYSSGKFGIRRVSSRLRLHHFTVTNNGLVMNHDADFYELGVGDGETHGLLSWRSCGETT